MRRAFSALAMLMLAAAAPVLPGIGASAGRVPVDPAAMPWRALARLQIPGEARCTAVLVGPRTALTAAHCLWGPRTRRFVPAGSIHVLTGYTAGRFARHAVATAYRLAAADTAHPAPLEQDAAIVTLAGPAGDSALELAAADPPAGADIMLGGYNQDRAEVIEADTHCHVVAVLPGRLIHDCAGTHGTSGAPLLARGADGMWRIVGLQVAAFVGRAGGIALPVSRLRALLPADPDIAGSPGGGHAAPIRRGAAP